VIHSIHAEVFFTTLSVDYLAFNRLGIIHLQVVSESLTGERSTDDGLLSMTADPLNWFGTLLDLVERSGSVLFNSPRIEGKSFLQGQRVCLVLLLLTQHFHCALLFLPSHNLVEGVSEERLFGCMFPLNKLSVLQVLVDALTEELTQFFCIGCSQTKCFKDMVFIHHFKLFAASEDEFILVFTHVYLHITCFLHLHQENGEL
jgi:hypothetical protein